MRCGPQVAPSPNLCLFSQIADQEITIRSSSRYVHPRFFFGMIELQPSHIVLDEEGQEIGIRVGPHAHPAIVVGGCHCHRRWRIADQFEGPVRFAKPFFHHGSNILGDLEGHLYHWYQGGLQDLQDQQVPLVQWFRWAPGVPLDLPDQLDQLVLDLQCLLCLQGFLVDQWVQEVQVLLEKKKIKTLCNNFGFDLIQYLTFYCPIFAFTMCNNTVL